MSTETPQTSPFTGWAEVLASLEQTLNHWLSHAVEPPPTPPPHPPSPLPLQSFEERLHRLQAFLDHAEQQAEEAILPLTAEIESVRQWLQSLIAARGNLVERTAGAV